MARGDANSMIEMAILGVEREAEAVRARTERLRRSGAALDARLDSAAETLRRSEARRAVRAAEAERLLPAPRTSVPEAS
ncbi:MAG: hypothetical protein ACFBWO_18230 [Paracoccaceae bacterium]